MQRRSAGLAGTLNLSGKVFKKKNKETLKEKEQVFFLWPSGGVRGVDY